MNRGGRKGGRNHKFFDSLTPMQNALDVIYTTPKVSGSTSSREEDGKVKQAAKLARRAAAARKMNGNA